MSNNTNDKKSGNEPVNLGSSKSLEALSELFSSPKLKAWGSGAVANKALVKGMMLTFKASENLATAQGQGTAIEWINFNSEDGTGISAKQIIRRGNGLDFQRGANREEACINFVKLVESKGEQGLNVKIDDITARPNTMSDNGRELILQFAVMD